MTTPSETHSHLLRIADLRAATTRILDAAEEQLGTGD
jgi:hypothetical protein